MRFAALVCAVLLTGTAIAADRHVYLNTTGTGGLNDCPNPQHSADGTSNKAKLFYCVGGTNAGKVVGTATGRVADCGAGVATAVTNGVSADIDGDGTLEVVYGHPQACVWNMEKSDSCEVHAGTYTRPGAQCNASCGDFSQSGGTVGVTCFDVNCWKASVIAYGYGPGLALTGYTGYGTAGSPGWLRGAVMGGSIDTWDANGDKVPDVGAYAPILSGDVDADGTFDQTVCSGSSDCSGDSYFALHVGCGGANGTGYEQYNCNSSLAASEESVKIDADNSDSGAKFETAVGTAGAKNVDYFQVKDIEFTRYNQGNTALDNSATNGVKERVANINLNGNGATTGLKLDHIYLHDYAAGIGYLINREVFNAGIADMHNAGCSGFTEIKDSYLFQNNRLMFADEGAAHPSLGCSWLIHDNRFLIDVQTPLTGTATAQPAFAFLKSYDYHTNDGRPKQFRFYNNEVMVKQTSGWSNSGVRFLLTEQFGNSGAGDSNGGRGLGQMWLYGNIFRNLSTNTKTYNGNGSVYSPFCSSNSASYGTHWKMYWFNNTFDGWVTGTQFAFDAQCADTSGSLGDALIERNNAMTWATGENGARAANSTCRCYGATASGTCGTFAPGCSGGANAAVDASRCAGATRYFTCGSDPVAGSGLAYYTPYTGGGLLANGSCDPDADGQAGFDTDGDGDQDQTWIDITGATISCPTTGAAINIGAIQSLGGAPPASSTPTLSGAKFEGGTVK